MPATIPTDRKSFGTPAERAARGAARMDEKRPGWFRRADVLSLQMGSLCRCVIGQEYKIGAGDSHDRYKDFGKAARDLLGDDYTQTNADLYYGFDYDPKDWPTADAFFEALRDAWVREITKRKAADE
jgi:hypothetical protein